MEQIWRSKFDSRCSCTLNATAQGCVQQPPARSPSFSAAFCPSRTAHPPSTKKCLPRSVQPCRCAHNCSAGRSPIKAHLELGVETCGLVWPLGDLVGLRLLARRGNHVSFGLKDKQEELSKDVLLACAGRWERRQISGAAYNQEPSLMVHRRYDRSYIRPCGSHLYSRAAKMTAAKLNADTFIADRESCLPPSPCLPVQRSSGSIG